MLLEDSRECGRNQRVGERAYRGARIQEFQDIRKPNSHDWDTPMDPLTSLTTAPRI